MATVVIPSYNRATLISKAIESALQQVTDIPFEVIVSDDHSTDDTVKIARSYGDRVRVVTSEKNRGPSANRNTAIRLARGEYIVMLDDDDRMLPGRIQEQVGFLERHPDVDLAVGLCGDELGDPTMEDFFSRRGIDVERGTWTIVESWRTILIRDFIGLPSASTYRKRLFQRAGEFDESVWTGDDFEFLVRAASFTPIACFNGPVSWRGTHEPVRLTTSLRYSLESVDLIRKVLETTRDLTEQELSILTARYGNYAHFALGAAVHGFGRRELLHVLNTHGHALPPSVRAKWIVASLLPWALVRRFSSMRLAKSSGG